MSLTCRNGHSREASSGCRVCASDRARRYYDRVVRKARADARSHKATEWANPVSELDACWAAGHFEGEGTVTILKGGRANHFRPIVTLASTDDQVIAFFCERWPATSLVHRLPGRNAKLVHTWRVASAIRVRRFLEDITPYLRTDRVKAKAALVSGYCSHMLAEQYNREGDKAWKLPIVTRIREMNQRGLPHMLLPDGRRVLDKVQADKLLPAPGDA